MFDNKSNIIDLTYKVELETIIKAICDISYDIGIQIQDIIEVKDKAKGFEIIDLFDEDFVKNIGVRIESLSDQTNKDGTITPGLTKEEFFSRIADHYNQELFYIDEFINGLNDSSILFINKVQNNLLSLNDNGKDRLIPALKNAKILKTLVSNLKSDKIKRSLEKIDMFENDIFYRGTISTSKKSTQPLLRYLNYSFIDQDTISNELVDKYDFWINYDLYKKLSNIDLRDVEDYKLIKDIENNIEIGLLVGDYLIPYSNVDLVKYIKKDNLIDYYWVLFKYTYSIKPNLEAQKEEIILEFKKFTKDSELNQLLSYLKNNFYLENNVEIKSKFIHFFNEVLLIEKLEHLTEYQFLMSTEMSQETTLGIYTDQKKGESYNLLHWLNHKTDKKLDHFRKSTPTSKDKKLIFTLKPSICYYFLLKYFEDFFEEILRENNYIYLANHKFFNKTDETEIDFLIKGTDKLYYVETKTKLSQKNIDKFLKKSSAMLNIFAPMIENGIDIEFILIGGYSDKTVNEYQYFIEKADNSQGYNVNRDGLNIKPYFFSLPIRDKQDKEIICIAEPEYVNLKNLLPQICQK